jgi:poly-gamma-glutamate synthesis protein (capsule biosynthesis protein)
MPNRKKYYILLAITFIIASAATAFILLQPSKPTSQVTKSRLNWPNLVQQVKQSRQARLIRDLRAKETKLLVTGDINTAGAVGENIAQGMDPFQFVRHDVFPNYDFIVSDLECNIAYSQTGQKQNKAYAFKADPNTISLIKSAGVDMVTLANNHTMDYGPVALLEQIQLLKTAGITPFGAGANTKEAFAPSIVTVNGTKIAWLAFNDIENSITDVKDNRAGSAYLNKSRTDLVKNAIAEAKRLAEIVIVYPQWGTEHSDFSDADQHFWGRLFVDAGADLVVGTHPHVIQPSDTYKGVTIIYSLGNFVSSGFTNPKSSFANMLEIVVQEGKIKNTKLIPIEITYHGMPKLRGS